MEEDARREQVVVTRMRVFSSSPPKTKRRDEVIVNRDYIVDLRRLFIQYCCWKTLAPLTLSDAMPPITPGVKWIRELWHPSTDLYEIEVDTQKEPVVWMPSGETRRHVHIGALIPAAVKGVLVRPNAELCERMWARSIHVAWTERSGGRDGDYCAYPDLVGLRLRDNDAENGELIEKLCVGARRVFAAADAKGDDGHEFLLSPMFGDCFKLRYQTHSVYSEQELDENGDVPAHAPQPDDVFEVEGGKAGDPNINTYIDTMQGARGWFQVVLDVSINDPIRKGATRPTEEETLALFSVYFNMLIALFVRDAFGL